MAERYCRVCCKWHDRDEWPLECVPVAPQGRSDTLPVPYFISDTMDPTEHVDGRFYTSKSTFRAVTKAHGCTEIGNDPARFRKPVKPKRDRKKLRDDIKRAEYMVKNGIPVSAVK